LWHAVVDSYELAGHELTLLREACRVADVCDRLSVIVVSEGPLSVTRLGEQRTHPALTELRQQQLVLARLIVALRVPLGDQEIEASTRTQYRGLRGVQQLGAGA
jgi:hypothetical protein